MFKLIVSVVAALGFSSAALAAPATDYGAITANVDITTVVAGITAMAGLMFGPKVARWGYKQVMSFLRG